MNHAVLKKDPRFYAYILLSLALTIPVMFWPLPLFVGITSVVDGTIEKNWLIAASLLLFLATVADSVIAGASSLQQMLLHATWVIIAVAVILVALREFGGTYLLGMMFFMHSLRSATGLWNHSSGWWLWPAWLRDTGVALAIFL